MRALSGRAAVLLLSLFVLLMPAARAQDGAPLPEQTVVLETAQGGFMIAAEVAATEAQRERGLMFRHRLPPDRGMLFIYEEPRVLTMWMKNTYIPLDMIFIRADGTVYHIEKDTVPESEVVIQPQAMGLGVLEVAAGTADRIGLKPGDKVVHPAFGPMP